MHLKELTLALIQMTKGFTRWVGGKSGVVQKRNQDSLGSNVFSRFGEIGIVKSCLRHKSTELEHMDEQH